MSIAHLLTRTCDLYAPTLDASGKQGYAGTATTTGAKCRVEASDVQIPDANGNMVMADAEIFLLPGVSVAVGWKVVVGSASYVVMLYRDVWGFAAQSHIELTCRSL